MLLLPSDLDAAALIMAQRLPDDARVLHGQTTEHIAVELRRLARHMGMSRTLNGPTTLELTGGVEIAVRVPACAYDQQTRYTSTRMRPGWEVSDLARRTDYMLKNARAFYQLRCARDGLYAVLRDAPSGVEMAMAEEEATTGHHSDLHEMTYEDIKYWWNWYSVWSALNVVW